MEVKKVCKSPKGTLSDLRPFLATKSPLKMMKVTSQQTIATHILLSTSRRTRPSGEGGGTEWAAALPKFSVDVHFFAN